MRSRAPSTVHGSDILEHLPVLRSLAREGDSVVEFGFRAGESTMALLVGTNGSVVSFDIANCNHEAHDSFAFAYGPSFTFVQQSSLEADIEEPDFLFIDSLHTYAQLRAELVLHGDSVKHIIAMHDTWTFGIKDEVGNGPGLEQAIAELLEGHQGWYIDKVYTNNNGLTVLRRKIDV